MPRSWLSKKYVVALVALLLLLGGTASGAAVNSLTGPARIYACVSNVTHTVKIVKRTAHCAASAHKISWNARGPAGATGATGPEGPAGAVGPAGAAGAAGADGATGPQGPPGPAGAQGIQGIQGIQGVQGEPGVVNQTTSEKNMTLSAPGSASLFSIALAAGESAGGLVNYTITATDGATQLATEHGTIQWNATGNSITCSADTSDKLHLGIVNSGCTPGFFNPGSQPGVSVFDNVSFSNPAPLVVHHVVFTVINDSTHPIRLEP
jgi:hypothetical protein